MIWRVVGIVGLGWTIGQAAVESIGLGAFTGGLLSVLCLMIAELPRPPKVRGPRRATEATQAGLAAAAGGSFLVCVLILGTLVVALLPRKSVDGSGDAGYPTMPRIAVSTSVTSSTVEAARLNQLGFRSENIWWMMRMGEFDWNAPSPWRR